MGSPPVPPIQPLPTPTSAADVKANRPVDSTAVAYKSLIANAGGSAGLQKPANTVKKSLLGN